MANQEKALLRKQWFVSQNENKKIEDSYDFSTKKTLGEGAFGIVYSVTMKESHIKRAIKQISKSKVKNPQELINEITIMKNLDHPNLIKLYEIFEDARYIYLVMELLQGGELFDKITDSQDAHLTEEKTRLLFRQIAKAVAYCHSHNIVHRDLKPENCILLSQEEDSPVKVIDFGMSCAYSVKNTKLDLNTIVGSAFYIAPEVLDGHYDERCDNFSLGVILYIMLSGLPPFYGRTDKDIFNMIRAGKFSLNLKQFQNVSEAAKDLIKKLLVPRDVRLSAQQILEHEWMTSNLPQIKLDVDINKLKAFSQSSKMKRVALSFIASQVNEQDIKDLGDLFRKLDLNSDGVLTIEEIQQGFKGKLSPEGFLELEKIFADIDTDGSGSIDYNEFIAASIDINLINREEYMYKTFRMFDADGSGKIDKSELKKILGNDPSFKKFEESYWDKMIEEVDINKDGEIDYNEFTILMSQTVQKSFFSQLK